MAKMIQIRNLPDELHRKPNVRAAQKGMTLLDYLPSEIESVAKRPTRRKWLEKVVSGGSRSRWTNHRR